MTGDSLNMEDVTLIVLSTNTLDQSKIHLIKKVLTKKLQHGTENYEYSKSLK